MGLRDFRALAAAGIATGELAALANGGDAHAVEHLSRLWQVFRTAGHRDDSLFRVTDAVERVTGGEPETLRDFLRANHESLFAHTGYGDR